jgi:hypothetical protein
MTIRRTIISLIGLLIVASIGPATARGASGISNTIEYAAGFTGSDFGAKVNAAIAALPSAGGTVDAEGLSGTQAMLTTIRLGSDTRPVKLILPTGRITARNGSQILYYTGSRIVGQGSEFEHGSIIDDTSSARTTIAYGGRGQPVGVRMEDFAVVTTKRRGSGSIAFDLTKVLSSSFYDLLARGSDIGFKLGGTGTCACYNRFYNVNSQSSAYGWEIGRTAASNQFFGGLAWGATGLYLNGGGVNTFVGLDIESSSASAVEITAKSSNNNFFGTYLEANANPIVLDPGTTGNQIYGGMGSGGKVMDNSGNTSNYYKVTGQAGDDGSWSYADAVQRSLFWGNSIVGDVNDKVGATIESANTFPIDLYYYGAALSIYGDWGHSPWNVGELTTYSGINDRGSVSLAALGTPATPVITQGGKRGTASYGPYYVVCHDAHGKTTNVSSGGSTSTGNATLSLSDYNIITWRAKDGCYNWDILKGDTSTALAINQRPAVAGTVGMNAAISFNDTGQPTSAYRIETGDSTDELHRNPLVIAHLPNACSPGDTEFVTNWTGITGVCSSNAGGTIAVTASCGSSNTWYCP